MSKAGALSKKELAEAGRRKVRFLIMAVVLCHCRHTLLAVAGGCTDDALLSASQREEFRRKKQQEKSAPAGMQPLMLAGPTHNNSENCLGCPEPDTATPLLRMCG